MATIRILVVDDEPEILILIREALLRENFTIFTSRSAENAIKIANEQNINLIILDLELGVINGWDVCKILKTNDKTKDIPIIMITAKHITTDDIVKGLDIGADDYVTKPFKLNVLVARINAILRRKGNGKDTKKTIETKYFKVILEERRVLLDEQELELTPKEFKLLCFILNKQNLVLDRACLMENVWGYEYFGNSRTVDKHIENIRKKLGKHENCIETIEGIGYKFSED
jgi:DNA-binding response OmpR family regulator